MQPQHAEPADCDDDDAASWTHLATTGKGDDSLALVASTLVQIKERLSELALCVDTKMSAVSARLQECEDRVNAKLDAIDATMHANDARYRNYLLRTKTPFNFKAESDTSSSAASNSIFSYMRRPNAK